MEHLTQNPLRFASVEKEAAGGAQLLSGERTGWREPCKAGSWESAQAHGRGGPRGEGSRGAVQRGSEQGPEGDPHRGARAGQATPWRFGRVTGSLPSWKPTRTQGNRDLQEGSKPGPGSRSTLSTRGQRCTRGMGAGTSLLAQGLLSLSLSLALHRHVLQTYCVPAAPKDRREGLSRGPPAL